MYNCTFCSKILMNQKNWIWVYDKPLINKEDGHNLWLPWRACHCTPTLCLQQHAFVWLLLECSCPQVDTWLTFFSFIPGQIALPQSESQQEAGKYFLGSTYMETGYFKGSLWIVTSPLPSETFCFFHCFTFLPSMFGFVTYCGLYLFICCLSLGKCKLHRRKISFCSLLYLPAINGHMKDYQEKSPEWMNALSPGFYIFKRDIKY